MTSLPLHPLLVHIPVVLVPLVLLMALPSLLSRRWFQWTAPITLALSSVAAVQAGHTGAQLVWQDAVSGSDAPASDPAAPPAGDGDGDAD